MDEDTDFSMADGIRRVREFFAYSQEGFAEMMGVSQETVSRWERGKAKPKKLQHRFLWALANRHDLPEEVVASLSESSLSTFEEVSRSTLNTLLGPGLHEPASQKISVLNDAIAKSARKSDVSREELEAALLSVLKKCSEVGWSLERLLGSLYVFCFQDELDRDGE